MKTFLSLISVIIFGLQLSSCTEVEHPLEQHADDCTCKLHNMEQEDLDHRDALSKSLDTLKDITPYNFHEIFTIHGSHDTENHTIDLVSWGNIDMPELIIILSNDKDHKRSHIVKLVGKLSQHWVRDLNRDGNPELVLFSASEESNHYGDLKILEFDENLGMKTFQLKYIELTEHNGYMGHDNFILHGDTIKRTFPRFLPGDDICCPTGGREAIDYLWEIEDYFELIEQK